MEHVVLNPRLCIPVVSWGNCYGKVPLYLCSNHMLFGYHYNLFYEDVEKYLSNIESIF